MPKTSAIHLMDIVKAVELLREEMEGVPLADFEADQRQRWIVERGVEIISEASRGVAAETKAARPGVPCHKIAAIGNVVRHEYRNVAPSVLWRVVRDELPEPERVCREELAAEIARDERSQP